MQSIVCDFGILTYPMGCIFLGFSTFSIVDMDLWMSPIAQPQLLDSRDSKSQTPNHHTCNPPKPPTPHTPTNSLHTFDDPSYGRWLAGAQTSSLLQIIARAMVMDYCSGGDLCRAISQRKSGCRGPFEEHFVKDVMQQAPCVVRCGRLLYPRWRASE